MPRRARLASIALVAVTLALVPGCTSDEALSAKTSLEEAEQRATEWDEDASLVRVVGMEGSATSVFEAVEDPGWQKDDVWQQATRDGAVGDGSAPVWLYQFTAEDQEGILGIAVGEGGEIRSEQIYEANGSLTPLDRWSIDSKTAIENASGSNQAIRETLEEGERVGVLLVLEQHEGRGRALWTILAATPGDETGGVSFVDAGSGQVLSSHAGTSAYPRER